MNFSAYSIKNPLVAILLFTLFTIGGIFAFKQMKIQQFPDIDMPAVITTVTMAGASPMQLENDIAKALENKLAGIEGTKHLRTTIQTGAVTVHSEFHLEKGLQEALDEVRSAVGEVRGDLPAAANEPIVSKVSTAGFPVAGYSVSSDVMNAGELSFWVDDYLSKRLSDLQGVGKISRIGGIERQITIAVNPNKIGGWQLPITHLSQQVNSLWQDLPAGTTEIGGGVQTVRVLGSGSRLDELQSLPITTSNGTTDLGAIADIYDGAAAPTTAAFLNNDIAHNQSVIAFSVTRSRGASEVSMLGLIDDELAKITRENPHIQINKLYDKAEPVYEDYGASMQMLIEGCILAVIVVLIFLKNWRATIVAAVALPLSIIPTFLVMWLFGFSLNVISLLALSLVIGVLVDDAIVEVENIMRHLHMGKTPFEAAMEAADEIGLAVVATTFTLIAVFLPTAFMSGVVGQFFGQFGWTASISIFISLLVARLITPMMAAYILKPEAPTVHKVSKSMTAYLKAVNWTLKNRTMTLVATFVLFIGSVMLAKFLPMAFIPNDDTNQTQVTIELTPDSKIEQTNDIALRAADIVQNIDGVSQVFVSVGTAGASMDSRSASAAAVSNAVLNVSLEPRGSRDRKIHIENNIREAIQAVPAARFKVGLSPGGESGYSFSLTSVRTDLLGQTVNQVLREISTINGVSVTSGEALPKPEIKVIPNRLAMAERGVNSVDLANTLRVATSGDYEQALPKMNFDTRQIPMVVRLSDDKKADLTTLNNLYVPNSKGTAVQVGEIAHLDFGTGPSEISRMDRARSIKITAESAMPLGELSALIKATPMLANLPKGVEILEEGQAESMNELFGGFVVAMGVGIFCIFGVLILLFYKVLQPFSILMALPLSIGGALIGLILTGGSLSMPSMIGFIMLMGIATKNSILLVDYAIIAQNSGKSQLEAIIDACQKRARPIIMTSVAMGAGMLPLVFGWGGADPTFRQPMAVAVLGGLVTSTFLSLVVIPVIYTLMDDLGNQFKTKEK